MQPNFPFLSVASNAILKPGGRLKWKKQLVKDARLSLHLTKVMKIVRLTSPLPNVLRLSPPRPLLRHGRRLALPCHKYLTLNLYTVFFTQSLALLPSLPHFPNYFLSQGVGFRLCQLPEIPFFCFPAKGPA